jgi:peptidoglycan/LPS O-acetylase OafA/YrhL
MFAKRDKALGLNDRYTSRFSANATFMKMALLFMVISGHVSAFWLPKMSTLSVEDSANWVILLVKAASSFGREAAIGFVFLSGFFTGHHFDETLNRRNLPGKLYYRVRRLYPEYFFALVLTLMVDSIGLNIFETFYTNQSAFAYNPSTASNIFKIFINLLFLEPIVANSLGTNGPLWTVAYLVQFYFFFTAVNTLPINQPKKFLMAVGINLLVFTATGNEWCVFFFVWLAGTAFRRYSQQIMNLKIVFPSALAILFFLVARFSHLELASLLISTGFGLTFSKMFKFQFGERLYHYRLIKELSQSAFFIYLVHFPILFCVTAILRETIAENQVGLVWFSLVLLIVISLAFGFSSLFQRLQSKVILSHVQN